MLIAVIDDGMSPRISKGDRVDIDTDVKKIREGDIVAAWKDGKIFIRRIYRGSDCLVLEADNPDYLSIKAHNYEILGKVVKGYLKVT